MGNEAVEPMPVTVPTCRFRFGMEYQGPNTLMDPHDYNGIDYITVWIGQNDDVRCV